MTARRRTVLSAGCLLTILSLTSPWAYAQVVWYGYDDLGRLRWVQDQNGDVAIYVYDPVGNILQIVRGNFPDPNAPVGISAFTPAKGGAGTTVTIFGRGFDPAPLQNTVTFSGTPATVTAATPVQLTVTVPSGAATGPIAVAAPAGSGTSAQSFTVLQAPTVSPAGVALFPKMTQTFTSTQPSQWRVNNAVGGNASAGTITQTGTTATYTAPAALPPTGFATITAANQDDFTLQGTATVEILSPTDPLRAPPVSVALGPGPASGLLSAPPVSVAQALPTLNASPLVSALVSVSLPPVFASPLTAPLLSVARALPTLNANPLAAPPVSIALTLPTLNANPLEAPLVSVARALPTLNASPLEAPLVAAAREPVITAAQDPATGLPAKFPRGTANQNVRLLGAGFTGATAVVFNLTTSPDGNITVNSFTVDSATQITANITIASGAAVSLRVARVTAGGVTSTAQGTGSNLLEVLP